MILFNLAISINLFIFFYIFALVINESIWEFDFFQKQVIFSEYR